MTTPVKILLIAPSLTKRLEFTLHFVSDRLGTEIEMVTGSEDLYRPMPENRAVIHYGQYPLQGVFSIYASGLLFESGIKKQETAVFRDGSQVLFYPSPVGFDLPSDIFSATFYLISRYEEYLPFAPDHLGRFEADQSLAWRYNFLEEPVIDQWIELLKSALGKRFPAMVFRKGRFVYQSTFDIDNPWAYLHKGIFRTSAGLLRALSGGNISEFSRRSLVLWGKRRDPYDNYEYITDIEEKYSFRSIFFVLLAGYGGYDTNYVLKSRNFKELLIKLKGGRTMGIHPSFKSTTNTRLLDAESRHFFEFFSHEPDVCRQHFLMISMPRTYRQFLSLGIRQDYSMGYASACGFRAGTSSSFRFYDLEEECETALVIHPFAVMDVTLRQYLSLSPGDALRKIIRIADQVKKVSGTFTSLWHNESLSDTGIWTGWRKVFEEMVMHVRDEL